MLWYFCHWPFGVHVVKKKKNNTNTIVESLFAFFHSKFHKNRPVTMKFLCFVDLHEFAQQRKKDNYRKVAAILIT